MKRLLILFFCFMVLPAWAKPESDEDKWANDTVDSMIDSYLKNYAETEVKKKIYEEIRKKLQSQIVEQAAEGAFVAYSVWESTKDYNKADTESQRFNAAMNMTVAIISYVVPTAGPIAQAVALGITLNSSLILQKHSLEILKIYQAAAARQAERTGLIKVEFIQDVDSMKILITRMALMNEVTKSALEALQATQEDLNTETLLALAVLLHSAHMQKANLDAFLFFSSRLVDKAELFRIVQKGSTQPITLADLRTRSGYLGNVIANCEKRSEEVQKILDGEEAVSIVDSAYRP